MVQQSTSTQQTPRRFETTIGDLICAFLEAANEVSSDSKEIEKLAYAALANLMGREPTP